MVQECVAAFFVARAGEDLALRRSLGGGPVIYVLDGVDAGPKQTLSEADLTPAITAPDRAARWRDRPLALHIDTGMNRPGVSLDEARALAGGGLKPSLVMSHLGRGEGRRHRKNAGHLARLQAARRAFPKARASLAASSGLYLGTDYRMDMVRPGIILFGGGLLEVHDRRFAAVARLESDILQIRDLKAGQSAS